MEIKTQILAEHIDFLRVNEETDERGEKYFISTSLDDKISAFADSIIQDGGSVFAPVTFLSCGEYVVAVISYTENKINSNIVVPDLRLKS